MDCTLYSSEEWLGESDIVTLGPLFSVVKALSFDVKFRPATVSNACDIKSVLKLFNIEKPAVHSSH